MQLEHAFTVPVGIDDAWQVLLDIERIAPCMPGAAIDSVDGDAFTGTVKVKLGPINLTYKGKASFIEKDETTHRAVIDARGRDARGNGTAAAKVTATLTDDGGSTKVAVLTDLDITGKPAQFGRGVMADVGNKLIGQFADCLAAKLSGQDEAAADTTAAAPATATAEPSVTPPPEPSVTPPAEPSVTPKPAAKPRSRPAAATGAAATATAASAEAVPAQAAAAAEPSATPVPDPATRSDEPAATPQTRHAAGVSPAAEVEPINLIESAGPAVAKRLAPLLLALVVLALIIVRRRRQHD